MARVVGGQEERLRTALRLTIPAPSTLELPSSLARRVLRRDGFACVYCGAHGVPLEVDHLRPRAHFHVNAPASAVHAPSNLVTACAECNQAKGPQNLPGFLAMLRGRGVPARIIAALSRRARAAARRDLPLALVS